MLVILNTMDKLRDNRWRRWLHALLEDRIMLIPAGTIMIRALDLNPDVCRLITEMTIRWAMYMGYGSLKDHAGKSVRQLALNIVLNKSFKLARMMGAGILARTPQQAFCQLYACDDEFYEFVCGLMGRGADALTAYDYMNTHSSLLNITFMQAILDVSILDKCVE